MPAVPAPRTWSLNEDVTSPNLNAGASDPLDFLLNKPAFAFRQSSAQSLTNNTWTSVTFTTENLDSDPDGTGGHSTSADTSRFVARYAGYYRVSGVGGFAVNATGNRGARLAVNGTPADCSSTVVASISTLVSGVPTPGCLVFLAEGDYVELQVLQSSGGSLNTYVAGTEAACGIAGDWSRN